MPDLRFGVFDDFKGARTLLLWGDASGLAALQSVLRELADGARGTTALHETGWAEGVGGIHLFLDLARSKWERRDELTEAADGATVKWSGTRDEFETYVDLIAPLISSSNPNGHQYLDSNRNSDLQIMVSRGEYPDDLH